MTLLRPMAEVAGRLVGLVQYIFSAGPVLRDGETLGASETERFRITATGATLRLILEREADQNA